jgi:hypothetical protein
MSEIVRVATKAIRMMLREQDDPELILISFPGSSGARVSIFRHSRTNFLYAVKCVKNSRVSLVDEIARKEILIPYLRDHLPKVLWCQIVDGFEVMISECTGVHTLHRLITDSNMPQVYLLAVWKDVVETLVHMWKISQHKFQEALCPRFFPARIQRIKEGLQSVVFGGVRLSECWDLPVIINGNEYFSVSESLEKITQVGKPMMGVVCHGDPQPSNIVVGGSHTWYCVDWEWAGPHQDWRMMLAHLYGWWSTRCLVLTSKPVVRVYGKRLEIEYEAIIPVHLQPYRDIAMLAVPIMSNGFSNKETVCDINRFLSALYFGELRFLGLWGREVFASSMLAQAVITANQQGQGESLQPFQFPQQKEQVNV